MALIAVDTPQIWKHGLKKKRKNERVRMNVAHERTWTATIQVNVVFDDAKLS